MQVQGSSLTLSGLVYSNIQLLTIMTGKTTPCIERLISDYWFRFIRQTKTTP